MNLPHIRRSLHTFVLAALLVAAAIAHACPAMAQSQPGAPADKQGQAQGQSAGQTPGQTLQIEAQEAHTMAKIENNLAGASDSQFRMVCLERYGFIPI